MGSEYATDPTSPLSSSGGAGGMLSPGNIGAVLRSASRGREGEGRSGSQVRGGALGFGNQKGRRKGLVRVAVDGVREWVGETVGVLRGGGRRW